MSWNLLRAGKKVIVIDEARADTPTRVASGVINPVTGRRIVRTWMIDTLLPFATQAYEDIGEELGIQVAREVSMLNFHATYQMRSAWEDRVAEGETYLQHSSNTAAWESLFNYQFGVGITEPCLLIDLHTLLPTWRQRLNEQGALISGKFDVEKLEVNDAGITYEDISAEKIIFCNGTAGFDNQYFRKLPFANSKGEALIVNIPGLSLDHIYKQGINIVPLGNELFWIGSSFEWEFEDECPSEAFRERTISQLQSWLKLPFDVLEHKAAVRPASLERRPFVGIHPSFPSVGTLNGMGTKGCSLAPYFAHCFTQYLLEGTAIEPAADLGRFRKLLGKK